METENQIWGGIAIESNKICVMMKECGRYCHRFQLKSSEIMEIVTLAPHKQASN